MPTPLSILIVDNDDGVRDIFIRRLKLAGHQVEEAEDGFTAIDTVLSKDFDVVLVDWRMPGLDGIETIRQIKRHKPAVRAILLSTESDRINFKTATDAGAAFVLNKDFEALSNIGLI